VGRQENHGEIKEVDWFSKFLLCHEKIPSFMGGKSKENAGLIMNGRKFLFSLQG
jgi:acetyl-CoA carboxylase carboxyltransferase component